MIQVLDRAITILDLISRNPHREHTLSELAGILNVNATTCANIVRSLSDHGFIESVGHRKGYRLGPKAFYLTRNTRYRPDLIDAAYPILEELVGSVNETCLLAVLRGAKKYALCHVECNSPLQIRSEYIDEQAPFETATGRLLVAYLPRPQRNRLIEVVGLPEHRWPEIESREDLERECEAIRLNGWCEVPSADGALMGVAFPVAGSSGVEIAIGLYLVRSAYCGSHRKKIITEMKRASLSITEALHANTSNTFGRW